MAVETSPQNAPQPDTEPSARIDGSSPGLLPGERVVAELETGDNGKFRLTHARILFRGGSGSNSVYSSANLTDVTSIQISQRPRARRSAAWGVAGLFAAIGVWQLTPTSNVGMISAIAVAAMSLMLMADYWIRPAGVHLEFHNNVGSFLGSEVGGKSENAIRFARTVEDAKRRLVPSRIGAPYRNYPSS